MKHECLVKKYAAVLVKKVLFSILFVTCKISEVSAETCTFLKCLCIFW